MKKIFVLFALVFSSAIAAFADIKAPVTPKPTAEPQEITKDGEMLITLTNKVDKPVLVITKEMFEKLRAEVDGQKNSSAAVIEGSDFNRTQTVVSGLFISLAFVFGGVWLVRNRGKVSKTAVGIVVFAILGMTATMVIANIRPPRNVGFSRAIFSGEMNGDNAYAEGKVKVLIGEGISKNDIELLIPRKTGE